MKLLSYSVGGRNTFGPLVDDCVADVRAQFGDRFPTLRAALAADAWDALREAHDAPTVTHALADVRFLPPITDSAKIFCVGVNYKDHREEAGFAATAAHPTIFTRFPDTHVGHLEPVRHPANTTQLDYEGEVAIVLARAISADEDDDSLLSAIAGYGPYNDLSVRDWQLHSTQWIPGKNFVGVGSFGPWITTLDEVEDLGAIRLETRVNGETVQSALLEDLIFNFSDILRYLAGFTNLQAGDVVVTGTPGGVGVVAVPPRFLLPGDVVEVEVAGAGTLKNEIGPVG